MAKNPLGRVIPGFEIGIVSTGQAGTDAVVTLTGTLTDKKFNFTIPRGEKGADGEKGETGGKGDKGDTGAQGIQGVPGVDGATGAKGDTGADGAKGDKGDKGDTGKGLDIRGYFDTFDALELADPDHAYMYGVGMVAPYDIWDWDEVNSKWVNNGKLQGADGKSAYQIAVDNGFIGTETDWLASLNGAKGDKGDKGDTGAQGERGADGAPGIQGEPGEPGAKGADGRQGIDGEPGKSAYTAATESGFTGSETVFGESLATLPEHLTNNDRHVTAEKQTAWDAKASTEQAQGYVDAHNVSENPHENMHFLRATDAIPSDPVPNDADTLQGASLDEIKALIAVKADNPVAVTFTLLAADWEGTEAPFTQTVNIAGLQAESSGVADIADSATDEQWTAYQDTGVRRAGQGQGSLTFKASEDKPAVDIPMQATLWG